MTVLGIDFTDKTHTIGWESCITSVPDQLDLMVNQAREAMQTANRAYHQAIDDEYPRSIINALGASLDQATAEYYAAVEVRELAYQLRQHMDGLAVEMILSSLPDLTYGQMAQCLTAELEARNDGWN